MESTGTSKNKSASGKSRKKQQRNNNLDDGSGDGKHVNDAERGVEDEDKHTEEIGELIEEVPEDEGQVLSASLNLNLQSNELTQSISPLTSSRSGPPDVHYDENDDLSDSDLDIFQQLPKTVTVLESEDGVKVYLVGTAHFSVESQEDVRKTIQLVNPGVVMLELCNSRRNILTLDEETILKQAQDISFAKVRSAFGGGSIQGVLHLVLLSLSAQLTKKLGMAPGGEFRVAMQEARKLKQCVVVLGDRPFNITLSRALASLSFFQKVKLGWQFLTSNDDITKEEIERCKEKDLLEKMLLEMTGEFPSITEVFLTERDAYLSHSLYTACQQEGRKPVVGVVGMGHTVGIAKFWGKTTDQYIIDISRVPEKKQSVIWYLVGKGIKIGICGFLVYSAVKIIAKNEAVRTQFDRIVQIGIQK